MKSCEKLKSMSVVDCLKVVKGHTTMLWFGLTCKHGNKCECVTLSESLDIDHRSLKALIKALIKLTSRS